MSGFEPARSAEPSVCAPAQPPGAVPQGFLPAKSCDTHCHVFGPFDRYPLAPARGYTPPPAPIDDYRDVMRAIGISRAVLIQPSVYGTDNRALLDALESDTADTLRGIVVVPPDLDDGTLDRMHDLGVRGVRINATNANGLPLSAAAQLDRRLRERQWHIQLQIDIERFVDLETWLDGITVPVVVDHFGFVDVSRGLAGGGFQRLRRLVERGICYVKMSAPYRVSAFAHPPYPDITSLAHSLVEANPDRVLWATDWPHPDLQRATPDDADLVRLVTEWLPDATNRRRVLAENPAALYWQC